MASSSWFPQSSSSKSRLSASNYELPRWKVPSSMSASVIPPPIVQSTYIIPQPHESIAQSIASEKPSEFEDRQHELEADLQFLLDAQAEGLIRGLEGGASSDDRSSTGSTTPTMQSVRSVSSRRRKPARRLPGLRSARKGIYNSIIALSALKDDELQDVDGQMQRHQHKLDQIEHWESKRRGLQEASENIDSGEETVRVQRLRQEADTLQAEINQVELQLADMRSRHRSLVKKATEIENNVQARMASYTASLRLLEEDVKGFLSMRPSGNDASIPTQDGKLSMWQLPSKRRTLDMARDYLNEQRDASMQQRTKHEHEKLALVEGAALWKECVNECTSLEKRLRDDMAMLRPSSPGSQSAWEEPPQKDSPERLKELCSSMDTVIDSLQSKYKTCEDQGWLLLVAAIGAELDALRKGKEIVAGVLRATHGEELIDTNGHEIVKTESSDQIHALDKSFETERPLGGSVSDDHDDHDEPDPELLFSRQDVDIE